MSAAFVIFRQSMKGFRGRLQTLDSIVTEIDEGLARFDAKLSVVKYHAQRASATSRDTAKVCDQFLERCVSVRCGGVTALSREVA